MHNTQYGNSLVVLIPNVILNRMNGEQNLSGIENVDKQWQRMEQ